jgi:bifunctional UDP-N-acetylglucosamine pyrophosphorylase/glucosamine-1-phosphate N-acetyltransferase
MIKKVVIPVAGRGTRMKEHSADKPKHLIEVNGQPFLYHLLTNLKSAGWEEFVLVYGYQGYLIEEFAEIYQAEFDITLVNQFEILGEEKYGTACAVEVAQEVVGEENFVVIYGDNLYSPKDLKLINNNDEYNYVTGMKNENWQNYGVLHFENDLLKEIVEKPKKFVGDMINLGLYKFTPEIFSAIKKIEISPRGEYELTDAINILAKDGKTKVKLIDDYWFDFGKPKDIEIVNQHLKNNF